MKTWKDFVKTAWGVGNTSKEEGDAWARRYFGMSSDELGRRMREGAPRHRAELRAPTQKELNENYIRRNGTIGASKPAVPRQGRYAVLGADPKLDETIEAGRRIMSKGNAAERMMAGIDRAAESVPAAVGPGAIAGASASSLPKVYGFLKKHRLPVAVTYGAEEGLREGIGSGSVANGLGAGISAAAMPYLLLGGPLATSATAVGTGSAISDYSENGNLPQAIRTGLLNGGLTAGIGKAFQKFPKTTMAAWLGLDHLNARSKKNEDKRVIRWRDAFKRYEQSQVGPWNPEAAKKQSTEALAEMDRLEPGTAAEAEKQVAEALQKWDRLRK